jgi:colicin import membrane protein
VASNGVLFGIIGALSVVVVGGGLYIAKQEGAFDPSDSTAAMTAPPSPAPAPTPTPPPPQPKPPVVAMPQPAPPPPPPSGTSQAEAMLAQQLVSDARQAIARGDFSAAARALDQAERLAPRSAAVVAARRDLREAQQHTRSDGDRVDSLVADARAAIARHDYVAASRLLDQAETIDRRDHDVQQARAELNAARQPPGTGRR